jgi:adenosylcobinamide-phosphate synthase
VAFRAVSVGRPDSTVVVADRWRRSAGRGLGAAVGLAVDQLVGEPPARWHPVAGFGGLMAAREQRRYRDSRRAGAVHAAAALAGAGVAGVLVEAVGGPCGVAGATWLASSGRMLRDSAAAVGAALEAGDLARARSLLPALVGRDPSGLDAAEITRAVVESVAENTVDAVVAPALWAMAAGGVGVLGHRAVNTLDAMVGHRSPRYARFGWASARLDDVAAWLPARVCAVAVAAVRPHRAAAVARAVRDQAPAHPSPNAGVAEAAFAAALGIRLGGVNRYGERVEARPTLGGGPAPVPADIARAARLSADVTLALGFASLGLAVGARWRGRVGVRRRTVGWSQPSAGWPWRPAPRAKRVAPSRVSPEATVAHPRWYSLTSASSKDRSHCS